MRTLEISSLGCEDLRDQQLQVVTKLTFVRGRIAFLGVVYYSTAQVMRE